MFTAHLMEQIFESNFDEMDESRAMLEDLSDEYKASTQSDYPEYGLKKVSYCFTLILHFCGRIWTFSLRYMMPVSAAENAGKSDLLMPIAMLVYSRQCKVICLTLLIFLMMI